MGCEGPAEGAPHQAGSHERPGWVDQSGDSKERSADHRIMLGGRLDAVDVGAHEPITESLGLLGREKRTIDCARHLPRHIDDPGQFAHHHVARRHPLAGELPGQ